jgi:hypothetical protein
MDRFFEMKRQKVRNFLKTTPLFGTSLSNTLVDTVFLNLPKWIYFCDFDTIFYVARELTTGLFPCKLTETFYLIAYASKFVKETQCLENYFDFVHYPFQEKVLVLRYNFPAVDKGDVFCLINDFYPTSQKCSFVQHSVEERRDLVIRLEVKRLVRRVRIELEILCGSYIKEIDFVLHQRYGNRREKIVVVETQSQKVSVLCNGRFRKSTGKKNTPNYSPKPVLGFVEFDPCGKIPQPVRVVCNNKKEFGQMIFNLLDSAESTKYSKMTALVWAKENGIFPNLLKMVDFLRSVLVLDEHQMPPCMFYSIPLFEYLFCAKWLNKRVWKHKAANFFQFGIELFKYMVRVLFSKVKALVCTVTVIENIVTLLNATKSLFQVLCSNSSLEKSLVRYSHSFQMEVFGMLKRVGELGDFFFCEFFVMFYTGSMEFFVNCGMSYPMEVTIFFFKKNKKFDKIQKKELTKVENNGRTNRVFCLSKK